MIFQIYLTKSRYLLKIWHSIRQNNFKQIQLDGQKHINFMKSWGLVVLLCIVSVAIAGEKWAVLVAGSNTYANYRHQSDVFHAYQMLIKNNFNPERIITFAYDDIANNVKNPFRGKVFNKPTHNEAGVDVYADVKIDYKGKDVTP